MSIGERISKLRKKLNMTQTDLAQKLYVSDKTISSYESDRTQPDLNKLLQLSDVLSTQVSYLLYGDIEKLDIETEIKIKLTKEEYDRLVNYFNQEASFKNEVTQIDTYYEPTHRKFTDKENITEWLRIGERGNKTIINYKNWYDNYCDEYEVEIDKSKNMEKIFEIIGLNKIAIVDKKRKDYLYKNKYQISLDEVKNLGFFIEIEVKKYDKSINEEYDDLLLLSKDLGLDLNKIDKRGYPYYFLDK